MANRFENVERVERWGKRKRREEKERRLTDNGTKENVPVGRASLRVTRSLLFTPGTYAYMAPTQRWLVHRLCLHPVPPIFPPLNRSRPTLSESRFDDTARWTFNRVTVANGYNWRDINKVALVSQIQEKFVVVILPAPAVVMLSRYSLRSFVPPFPRNCLLNLSMF